MQRRAFTLLELSLASSLVAVVLLVASVLLYYGMRNWRQLDQTQDASFQLTKACRHLRQELRQTSFNKCRVDQHGEMGDVVTFLSALDESTGEALFQPDGSPFWQRNVVYYLAQPTGDSCRPLECVHKRLLRLSLDTGTATQADSDPAVSEEDLLSDPLDKLSVDAPTVALNLQGLKIQLAPEPIAFPDEVKVEVLAERSTQMQFSVFPRNNQ